MSSEETSDLPVDSHHDTPVATSFFPVDVLDPRFVSARNLGVELVLLVVRWTKVLNPVVQDVPVDVVNHLWQVTMMHGKDDPMRSIALLADLHLNVAGMVDRPCLASKLTVLAIQLTVSVLERVQEVTNLGCEVIHCTPRGL
jgi:hypothetical protein